MPDRRRLVSCPPAFGRVALVNPAGNALIENPEIAIPLGVQLFVGQTGQLMGTRSVEDDNPLTRDVPVPGINAVNGNRQRSFNMPD
jgi:hypothetical protein